MKSHRFALKKKDKKGTNIWFLLVDYLTNSFKPLNNILKNHGLCRIFEFIFHPVLTASKGCPYVVGEIVNFWTKLCFLIFEIKYWSVM